MSRLIFVLALVVGVFSGGCGGCENNPGELVPCDDGIDDDGDQYGVDCPAGPDCDDSDPARHDDCCASDPTGQGCACNPATDSTIACYDGPADTESNLPCEKGMRSCDATTSTWSACGGQVLPDDEVCDGGDNDCDAMVDEAVMSACGNCVTGCDEVEVGDDPFPVPPMDPTVVIDGVGLDPNGDLILDQTSIENHFLWIANDAEGTVSKIDTRTGYEIARYPTVTDDAANGRVVDHTGGRPYPAWNAGGGGPGPGYADNRPSRTAIDFFGDMWVANRAHDVAGLQPTITKILNDPLACPDVDGNGTVETSNDANGDHVITLTDPLEFFEDDECIAMTVVVGAINGTARALAIDAGDGTGADPGDAWVGMHGDQNGDNVIEGEAAFYQINGLTGAIVQRVPVTGMRPYGAAIDSVGRLWTVDHCCGQTAGFGYIDTTLAAAVYMPISTRPAFTGLGLGNYGITVDLEDRVWIGGYPYGGLYRYNPVDGSWLQAMITGYASNGQVRGVAIDLQGNIWAAFHPGGGDGLVARIDADTGLSTGDWQLDQVTPAISAIIPVGVGVDFGEADGSYNVWTNNQNTSNISRLHIDGTTFEPAPHPATGRTVDVFPVGRNPYTYSDFTGLGLRTVTRPTGEYTVPIQGCPDPELAHWTGVTWEATTPPGTSVEIEVRAGNDLATLATAPLFGIWTVSPADLTMPPGPVPDSRYLLLTIRLLSTDREATPIVHAYGVQWTCPGPDPG